MAIRIALADLDRHCKRMKELPQEEQQLLTVANATPPEEIRALDDETDDFMDRRGPDLIEYFVGVTSVSPSRKHLF